MASSDRLLKLLQALRVHRRPVRGEELAEELGISLRTLYRDIARLREQGARIEGEAGVGYVLHPGFLLPPLMFSEDELEALVLGSRWVAKAADEVLGKAAIHAMAKIAAVLPRERRRELEESTLMVGPKLPPMPAGGAFDLLRKAMRTESKVRFRYLDERGVASSRIAWPFAMGMFESARVLAAWCETRQDFRHFRADRIVELELLGERYPRRRSTLLSEWRERQKISR